jgi:hypothetical protein
MTGMNLPINPIGRGLPPEVQKVQEYLGEAATASEARSEQPQQTTKRPAFYSIEASAEAPTDEAIISAGEQSGTISEIYTEVSDQVSAGRTNKSKDLLRDLENVVGNKSSESPVSFTNQNEITVSAPLSDHQISPYILMAEYNVNDPKFPAILGPENIHFYTGQKAEAIDALKLREKMETHLAALVADNTSTPDVYRQFDVSGVTGKPSEPSVVFSETYVSYYPIYAAPTASEVDYKMAA